MEAILEVGEAGMMVATTAKEVQVGGVRTEAMLEVEV